VLKRVTFIFLWNPNTLSPSCYLCAMPLKARMNTSFTIWFMSHCPPPVLTPLATFPVNLWD
jgi:hypothetical protein